MEITYSLQGDDLISQAMTDPRFIKGPLRTFLTAAGHTVQREGMIRAPVDTGRMRASIIAVVRPLQATISPTVGYALFVEEGTRPHWPPVGALQPWSRRHGFPSAFVLARAIAARGTRPHPFMRPALSASMSTIRSLLNDMKKAIEGRWSRGQTME